jgi:hypothetical protein
MEGLSMLEAFKDKTAVVIVTSIAGLAEPLYDLERAFEFRPGQCETLNAALAKHWIRAGIARPVGDVGIN